MGALQNKLSLNGSFSCLTGWREVFLVGGVRIEPPLFFMDKTPLFFMDKTPFLFKILQF